MKILLLEDSHTDAELIFRLLQRERPNCKLELVMDKHSFENAMIEFVPDVILSDHSVPQFDSTEALKIARTRFEHIPFILVSGTVSDEYAANIIKEGADDYILKDRMQRLPAAIDAAINRRKSIKEITDYKYALDQSADITITDQNGTIIYANENFCRLSQFSAAELIGSDHKMINSGHHPSSFFRDLWSTITKGKIWHGEVCNKARDGSLYWVDTTIVPFLNAVNKPYQYLAIRRNITQRKKAEEELLRTQMRFKQAQAVAHLGNWEINFLQNKSRWSDEAYRIYGEEPGDHNYSIADWLSFVHPDDLDYVKEQIKGSERDLSNLVLRHRIVRKDGTVRIIYAEAKYELDSAGKPVGLYGITHDITESAMAEEELRRSNERFQNASMATSDIIWELNFDTKEYLVHEGGEKLFGVKKQLSWTVGTDGKYIVAEDRERIRESFRLARRNPDTQLWQDEYRVYDMNNSVIHIVNHAVFLRDKEGRAVRAIGAISDITERKNLEARILEQQKQEQLKITATAIAAQEKERNAIGQELHDNVNQILVGTNLVLSMVKNNPAQALELVATSMKNLQLAIAENRKLAHELATPDLKKEKLIDQFVKLTENMLEMSNISVFIDDLYFDENRLSEEQKLSIYRIAQEQCTNIVKYSKASKAELIIRTQDSGFTMIIADNGIGMETNKKPTGIGLKNINARLSVLNGSLQITTAKNEGFKLEIRIPLS